jgi:hypothetical protein
MAEADGASGDNDRRCFHKHGLYGFWGDVIAAVVWAFQKNRGAGLVKFAGLQFGL